MSEPGRGFSQLVRLCNGRMYVWAPFGQLWRGFLEGTGVYVTGMWERAWEDTVPCHLCLSLAVDAETASDSGHTVRYMGNICWSPSNKAHWERDSRVGCHGRCVRVLLLCIVTVYTRTNTVEFECDWTGCGALNTVWRFTFHCDGLHT